MTWGKDAMTDPFDTTTVLGMCYDEARAFWHLIKGGVLDRFPTLRFYITHAGGFIPYQLMRLAETSGTMAPDAVNERPLLDYLGSFWFDPQIHDPTMRRAMIDVIGVDQQLPAARSHAVQRRSHPGRVRHADAERLLHIQDQPLCQPRYGLELPHGPIRELLRPVTHASPVGPCALSRVSRERAGVRVSIFSRHTLRLAQKERADHE